MPTSSRLRAFASALACAASLFAAGAAALAQERNASPQEKAAARNLLDQGRAAEARGDLPDAIQKYRVAHTLMGVPTTGIYLSLALSRTGKLVEAREIALSVARAPVLPGEGAERARAREDAGRLAASLEGRIPLVEVRTSPPDAQVVEIRIDEQVLPPSARGMPWPVDPGPHVVAVKADGFAPGALSVALSEGARQAVVVELASLAPQPPTVGPPGPFAPQQQAPRPRRGVEPVWIVAVSGLALGGASLAVGTVTGAMSLSQTADIEEQCSGTTCPSSLRDRADGAQTLATVSNVTMVAGGALAVAGGVALAIGLSSSPERRVGLALTPTSVLVEGAF